ncbi:MAG TPA: hypothetical protein VKG38_10410 [Solirubrobacteraceae bacterium]|nr:hypothetical protein [Solirubrobacteraceae bacterium]
MPSNRPGPTVAQLAVLVFAVGFVVAGFALQFGGGHAGLGSVLIAVGALGSLAVGVWTRLGPSDQD